MKADNKGGLKSRLHECIFYCICLYQIHRWLLILY